MVIRAGTVEDSSGYSAGFAAMNRNKRSMLLDLRDPGDRERFTLLVKAADVLVTSMRAKARERLGIDYTAMREVNPRLVYLSISAFGEGTWPGTGPGLT